MFRVGKHGTGTNTHGHAHTDLESEIMKENI